MENNYKKSKVLMKTQNGYEHMFESITDASKFAEANSWTMALKMQVIGYFEDKNGNKYYRQDKMKTKNDYKKSIKYAPTVRKKAKASKKRIKSRKIIVDGEVFESITEAEKHFNVKKDTFGQALRQGRLQTVGHIVQYADSLPQFTKPITEIKQPIVDAKPKEETKESIIINSEDPAIKAINDKIVEILKKANVYDEIQSLSKAIKKLSK